MRHFWVTDKLNENSMNRKNWPDEKLFFRLLNNKSDKTYWDNISELRSRPTDEVFKKSLELTKSKKPNERIIGIDILAQLGVTPRPFYKQTIKRFFELLKAESNKKVLGSLLYAIGHNNDSLNKSQITLLSSYKNHKDNWVKEGLVFAIIGLDNPHAIDTSIILSNDKVAAIRNWATFGLGTLIERDNKAIRNALWERTKDMHQETKLEAIVGLAKRKDLRVIEIIKQELIKGKYGTLIFEAIEELNDKQFLPLLQQNLKTAKLDKEINPEWLKDLEDCIKKIKKNAN